jgi:hypothetical protein
MILVEVASVVAAIRRGYAIGMALFSGCAYVVAAGWLAVYRTISRGLAVVA